MTEHKPLALRVGGFFDEREITISLPGDWKVMECRMAGHDIPALSMDDLRRALRQPIESPRLSELARGARQVCILIDDLTRPTPADRIAPLVLEELHEGGVRDECIRFLCALGAHRPMTYPELAAKLGSSIVEMYPVYPHSIWENLVHLGETSHGTPVVLNREFVACDLRIGIGCIFPHSDAVSSGGAKIVMPGIAGIDSIIYHHQHHRHQRGDHGIVQVKHAGTGNAEDSDFRLDVEEATRIAGLQFKVDVVLNTRREVAGMFCGDFVAEHRHGMAMGREVYRTLPARDADVVLANLYPAEVGIGRCSTHVEASLRKGGDIVLVSHAWDGLCLHQIGSRFGSDFGGRLFKADLIHAGFAKADRVYLLAPHLSRYDALEIAPQGKLMWFKEWGDLLAELGSRHGPGTRVAVYPYAPMQVIPPNLP